MSVGDTYPRRGFPKRGERIRLKLPAVGKFDQLIFNASFIAFLEQIKAHPTASATHHVVSEKDNVELVIGYDPVRSGVSLASFLSFDCANAIDRNQLFNALRGKSKQLKPASRIMPTGIIVCDGGCRLLTSNVIGWNSFTVQQIVTEFFRQYSSITFVLVIGLKHDYGDGIGHGRYRPDFQLFLHPKRRHLKSALEKALEGLTGLIPPTEGSPENVLRIMNWKCKGAFYGGMTLTDRSVRISAITLLEVLAGKLSYEQFGRVYGLNTFNPFAKHLERGELIESVQVTRVSDRDDDWIEFRFGSADVAVGPFSTLKRSANERATPPRITE